MKTILRLSAEDLRKIYHDVAESRGKRSALAKKLKIALNDLGDEQYAELITDDAEDPDDDYPEFLDTVDEE